VRRPKGADKVTKYLTESDEEDMVNEVEKDREILLFFCPIYPTISTKVSLKLDFVHETGKLLSKKA
jgi:hypothetical protein